MTISFNRRDFEIRLWDENNVVATQHSSNAAANLISCMDAILGENIHLEKIGFLAGPGSFTSSRIIAATCAGIKIVKPEILVVPVELSRAVRIIDGYSDAEIILRTNNFISQVSKQSAQWMTVPNSEATQLYTQNSTSPDHPLAKPWPDVSYGIFRITQLCTEQREIRPYYGDV